MISLTQNQYILKIYIVYIQNIKIKVYKRYKFLEYIDFELVKSYFEKRFLLQFI
jgi:hypothetical protein